MILWKSRKNVETNMENQEKCVKAKILIDELKEVRDDMNRAYTNLENVVDDELIDCLIYELNATQIRYKVILNQVKKLQIK